VKGQLVFGRHSVLAALTTRRRTEFHALYLQKTHLGPENQDEVHTSTVSTDTILESAKALNIPVLHVTRGELDRAVERVHNGVALDAAPLSVPSVGSLSQLIDHIQRARGSEQPDRAVVVVCLDRVMDVMNLGAVLRSCAFFDADAIVMDQRNNAPLSAVVSKASSGAMEFLPLFYCPSLPKLLASASSPPSWRRIAMDATNSSAIDCTLLSPVAKNTFSLVVVGNEGKGLRKEAIEHCDEVVKISRSAGGNGLVDSLNVSNSVAVMLFQLLGRRGNKE